MAKTHNIVPIPYAKHKETYNYRCICKNYSLVCVCHCAQL